MEGHGEPERVRPRHDLELRPRRDPRAAELHDQRPAGLILIEALNRGSLILFILHKDTCIFILMFKSNLKFKT